MRRYTKQEEFWGWVLGFGVVIMLALLVTIFFASVNGISNSNMDELDRLQQKNYRYEAEQRRIQEYIELQRERNRIESGYYQ